ncbi:WecB/TagA/CpsF family glycosyltransferase [Virgibacillus sp. NKC19-3]|uniref:WecB/TagA/CpsF family glycosyltransferase n=1 Tax=Virgibacillus saliphilus TaxID=2831674 RepID=UPI001C9B0412|nr:WecB/TagA/CpsF family glycosyltransferase [Virgibacillus sp. NKC19-3]MBY7144638.1 WecB/TagA/CpsF family glycosyltransferase [Virgibacillus sp. NKC19-3]
MHDSTEIMGIKILKTTKDEFLRKDLLPRLQQQDKSHVVTANPEIVMKTREDLEYKQIVQSADYVVPDGAGILLAAKYMKQPLPERIAGYDLMMELLELAEAEGLSCYFLGAKEDVNEKTVSEAKKKFPGLSIAGRHHGFFDIDDPEIVAQVVQTDPDLIFVALGLPRQEQWIAKHKDKFRKGLFMGIGGSFDILAGEVKRAPEIWIKLNLEWLYRLLKQPFRWKRMLKVFEFMFRVVLRR